MANLQEISDAEGSAEDNLPPFVGSTLNYSLMKKISNGGRRLASSILLLGFVGFVGSLGYSYVQGINLKTEINETIPLYGDNLNIQGDLSYQTVFGKVVKGDFQFTYEGLTAIVEDYTSDPATHVIDSVKINSPKLGKKTIERSQIYDNEGNLRPNLDGIAEPFFMAENLLKEQKVLDVMLRYCK